MNPGSDEAIASGCKCPVLDNGHGAGYLGGMKDDEGKPIFVINEDCPLHGRNADVQGCISLPRN